MTFVHSGLQRISAPERLAEPFTHMAGTATSSPLNLCTWRLRSRLPNRIRIEVDRYEVRSVAVDDARKNVAAQRPLGGASKRMLVSRRPSTGATSFPETTKSPAVAGSVD